MLDNLRCDRFILSFHYYVHIEIWFSFNKLSLNKKSYNILFCTRPVPFSNDCSIKFLDTFKYLCLLFDSQLSFKPYTDSAAKRMYNSANCFPLQLRKGITIQFGLPILDYADMFHPNTFDTNLRLLNVIYTAAFADLISGALTKLITV